jgi:Xaa-Pro aminopeptidase
VYTENIKWNLNQKAKKIFSLVTLNIDTRNIVLDKTLIKKYCNKNRVIKSKDERNDVKKACDLTSEAILHALKLFKNKNYKYCYLLISEYIHYLSLKNINYLAFKPICTSGKGNNVIHSTKYQTQIKNSDLQPMSNSSKSEFLICV